MPQIADGTANTILVVDGAIPIEWTKPGDISFRTFIFPMTALFLVWYFVYVLLAAFAPDFMSTKVAGNINVGLLFGFGQFVSTFAITIAYKSWADKTFDPAAAELREELEAGAR